MHLGTNYLVKNHRGSVDNFLIYLLKMCAYDLYIKKCNIIKRFRFFFFY